MFLSTFRAVFRSHWQFLLYLFFVVFSRFDWLSPVFRRAKDAQKSLSFASFAVFRVIKQTGNNVAGYSDAAAFVMRRG